MKQRDEGYLIVLTAEIATASDYWGATTVGFINALPENYFKSFIRKLIFRIKSDKEGRVKRAPYGLAKVEAKLLESGFSRNDVIIANPRELDKVIGPRTKILGIYTMDPLGLSYGSGIIYWILKLADLPYRGIPYIARSFLEVLEHPVVKKFRKNLIIIVGGPASWQLVDTGMQSELGIDIVFEGEFEDIGPEVFRRIINGEKVESRIVAKPAKIESIVPIVTPSIGGIVEVTRGCGRGCKFCTPAQAGNLRSIPFEIIKKEISLNIEIGKCREITLHSDEFFRYGSTSIHPRPEKVLKLVENVYKLVKSYGNEYSFSTDFTTAAVVYEAPDLVKKVSEYMCEGDKWNFIEMGIETGSPKLLKELMFGKVLPYKPEQYHEIVEQAIGILNDNHWIVVATFIVNLPGETEEDVIQTLELLDKIKHLKVMTFPLPFIPMGKLRGLPFTVLDKILEDPVRREFILKAFDKAFSEAIQDIDIIVRKIENPITKFIIKRIALACFNLVLDRYRKKLGSLTEHGKEIVSKLHEEFKKAHT